MRPFECFVFSSMTSSIEGFESRMILNENKVVRRPKSLVD